MAVKKGSSGPKARSPRSNAPARPPKTRPARRRRAEAYSEAIAALDSPDRNVTLEFAEGEVTLTNLDKVLWRATARLPAYSRRDHMRYLLRVADYMLPHVQDRPLTLIRQPEGVSGRRFVQFHWEQSLPRFVESVAVYSERNRVAEDYLVCNNVPTLLWLAHVGCLELHA